jgi:hypothetical protein
MRAAIIALCLMLTWPAAAATLGEAKTGFSADRVLVIDGKTYDGRIWTMPGKERHEQNLNGIPAIFVLRSDTPLADIVLPKLHTVVEFPLPAELHVLTNPRLTRKPVGQETVNGVATTKYAVDETVPEGHGEGFLWLGAGGIPMKMDGTFTRTSGRAAHLHWELHHVRLGPQPPALFEPPRDYAKLPPEAVAPLLGLRLKGSR